MSKYASLSFEGLARLSWASLAHTSRRRYRGRADLDQSTLCDGLHLARSGISCGLRAGVHPARRRDLATDFKLGRGVDLWNVANWLPGGHEKQPQEAATPTPHFLIAK